MVLVTGQSSHEIHTRTMEKRKHGKKEGSYSIKKRLICLNRRRAHFCKEKKTDKCLEKIEIPELKTREIKIMMSFVNPIQE